MLILTNITEKKTLELKMAEERSNLKLVVKALARKADVGLAMEEFRDFMAAGARDVVASAAAPGAALAELFRLVHTCKGDFAQLGFHRTAGRLHGLEDALAALAPEEATRDGLAELVRGWDAEEFLREDKATLANVLGKAFFERDETFPVSREELVRLASMAERLPEGGERDELLAHLRTMQRHSVRDLLREHEEYVAALAERLEKHIEPLAVTGDDVLVDKRDYRAFLKSLVHVFRNMVDHGIEAVEQRVEADKPELGRIACHVERLERDGFAVTLSDDGRGIDRDLVLRKAVEKGVIDGRAAAGMTGDEVFGLLFLDSFSTRDNVSALSGRGVGLAAVKAETEALGGRVEVGSEPGRGSRFRFVLPAL
jgi:two-component system chemotaxis sensor kinase CheA